MTVLALTGGRVLTEDGLRADATVLVEGGVILDIVARPPTGAEVRRLAQGDILAPGFVDVQANGGGGVLFNATPTAEAALAIAAAHRRYGTTSLLPTLITDRPEVMAQAVDAAREARGHPDGGVAGIHLEGPFLSRRRPGVHDPRLIRRMVADDASWLAAQAPTLPLMLTLAPEEVEDGFLVMLARAGAVLSAGHTAASFERIAAAAVLGLTGMTHLYNAMPPLAGREPGPVGAALLNDRLWCGLIVDGVHVHSASLRLALAARPAERMLLVTDAMSVLGTTDESFQLYGETILRRRGRLERADGTLAGADLDMATAVRNSVSLLGLDLTRALRMASTYPAAFMRLADRGRIASGLRADFVLLGEALEVRGTWVGGRQAGLSAA
jgi:N-acetylglucosamine-6-phosphate deacetylase